MRGAGEPPVCDPALAVTHGWQDVPGSFQEVTSLLPKEASHLGFLPIGLNWAMAKPSLPLQQLQFSDAD